MSRFPLLLVAASIVVGCGSENNLGLPPTKGQPGSTPPLEASAQVDVITQVTVPVVDILFAVDNSCSMADKQAKLAENFPRFMQFFVDSGLDYHIGVTEMERVGNLRTNSFTGQLFVAAEDPNPVVAFQQMAKVGDNGVGEYGRAATFNALEIKRDTVNAGFVRDEAVQHVIFVSDELDQSGSNPVSGPEFVQWMAGFKPTPDLFIGHVIEPQNNASCDAADPSGGNRYKQYSDATGGVWFNMCLPSDQWGGFLEELGLQTSGLKREFFLSKTPIPESIVVVVTQTDEGTGNPVTYEFHQDPNQNPAFKFTYSRPRNSITFDEFIPESFADVSLQYELLEGALQVTDDL